MRTVSVADNGTTVIELSDAEAHALRNVLRDLPGSPVAHQLQRHLAMAHGEALPDRTAHHASPSR